MRVSIKPEVLQWVINYSQKPYEELEKRYAKLGEWLRGDAMPTMNQVKDFAKYTRVPIGYLFLTQPPKEVTNDMPAFRTVTTKESMQYSRELVDTINSMRLRQDWLSEYRKKEEYPMLSFIGAYDGTDIDKMVADSYKMLDLYEGWQKKLRTKNEASAVLIQRLENIGISVFINGIVGNNTSRKLRVDEFRGFTLLDPYAPIIFINSADTDAARLFTLLHEFCHILLGQEGVTNNIDHEVICNRFAANFLVPKEIFLDEWREHKEDYGKLSSFLKVSELTIYRIAFTYHVISEPIYHSLVEAFYKKFWNQKKKKKSGGDFYKTSVYRVGRTFGITVDRAAKSGELLYGDAYDLLGVKGDTYNKVIDKLTCKLCKLK
ncbi:ImmA/IrrE family metallo-endopeptidase [uncultured Veillonella sp.]|uniref:ImmA/IrrE family metallo-endopeptidase n=1 Tax=uncultured Veillonella sp. TaxID=159268 RepID=UPI002598A0F3|nr:ImmA/IrrE family metallo-endopeptidase [uncultured Veillonella sp.]